MVFEISEYYTGGKIRLKPRVELYDTRDYMGKQMPGLAIVLDEVDQNENVTEQLRRPHGVLRRLPRLEKLRIH